MSAEVTDDDYRRLLAFRTALRRFVRWSEQEAGSVGLTPAVHQLLLAVRGLSDDGAPTIGDVAEVLLTRHHSTVELAARAEDLGLLRRERADDDGRRVRLTLTPEGTERLAELSRRTLPQIARLADVLAAAADEHGPVPSARPADLPPD